MTKDGWQASLTQTVAGEIRRYRKLRGLSVQALADRCAQLGMAMPAAVLSNLELGRRESVSVAELVVIAQVLDVSPTLLMVPVTTVDKMEILPGREAGTTEVLEWFAGETRFVPARTGRLKGEPSSWDEEGPAGYVHLYRVHQQLVAVLMPIKDDEDPGYAWTVSKDADQAKPGAGELRAVRRAMQEDGLRLPALPPELAHVDPDKRAE
jgi:transcriptional regulator with XRE-family HTH domain